MSETLKNRWPKRIGLILMGLIGLALLAVIGLRVWIGSSAGQAFVEATIEDLDIAGQRIEIDGLDGSVLGQFKVDRIELTGRDGVWLVARDVSVDWSPSALLSKTLDVNAVQVVDLDILQRPIFVPSGSNGEKRIETFDVDGIDLPDIFVGEPIVGQAIQMSASGDLRHGPDGGDAVLSARSDQDDIIEADLAWSPDLVLSGEADIDGAPGGLIAGLLRLNPGQRVTADVTTKDEQTQLVAQIDSSDFADLLIQRGQSQVSVSGTLQPDVLPVLARLSDILGGETKIEATLPLDQGVRTTVAIRSPLVTLDASGAQQDDVIVIDELTMAARDPLRSFNLEGVSIGTLTATGQARLGETYSFEGQVEGQNIRYKDYAVDRLQGPATLTLSDNRLLAFDAALTGRASTTQAARANGARVIATGQINIETRNIDLSRADIALPGLGFQGRGSIDYGEVRSTEFSGRYDVDTKLFRDRPSAKLSGQATLRSTANGPVADVAGRARNITGLASAVEPLVPDGFTYKAMLHFQDGTVIVPRFTASNALFDAKGSARWRDGRIKADIDYDVERYAFAAVTATDAQGRATLSGPPSEITFETTATVATLDAGALNMTAVEIDSDGTYSGGVIAMQGDLSGDSEQGRITTSGQIMLEDGEWAVSELEGALGDLMTTGTLSGVGGDIAALRGDLIMSGTSPIVPADVIEAKILLSDAQVDIDATLTGLNLWRLDQANVRLLAKGPRDAVAFDVEAEGRTTVRDVERPLTLTTNGVADLRTDALSTRGDFDLAIGTLTLAGEASARQTEQGWAGALDAAGLGGEIKAALEPDTNQGLSFDLKSVSIAQLLRLLARPVSEGTVSGKGRFTPVADGIEGSAMFSLDDLRSPISNAVPISVVTQIELVGEQLTATMRATEGGLDGQAVIQGPLDTLPTAPFLVYPLTTPLQGRADLRGEIGPVVELFLPPRTDVAGQIDTDLEFTVPTTPTGLAGRIALTEGRFEQGVLGLNLKNITMIAELSGETFNVPTLSAEGVSGGTLSGSGRMGLGEGTGTVDIQAEKLRVVDRREGNAEVSGELTVSRTAELFRLAGDLRVTDADLNIARLPKPGLPTLDVDFGDQPEEEADRSFATAVTELDVKIISNGRIKVTGRGLNASMNLNARVRGAFDNPVVAGDMSIARGRFDFLSKRFEFRESSVILRDDVMQSILSLEAVRQTPDLTAVVAITGTLDRPEIKLTSEPNLPEDEVLSRILFGRSPTQLSAIEAARLAAALTQLSGGSGFDLFGSLENAVGLDTLEIGQNDTGQAQLTTGKYLSDDVYLEIRTAAEGTPGIAVEWQVRNNISLEAETLPDERQKLSVQWKKDFD